jgi:hypothetical protein
MLQRTLPAGFIAPCLPTKTDKLPSGGQWLYEIKHDGFRVIALLFYLDVNEPDRVFVNGEIDSNYGSFLAHHKAGLIG